MSLTKSSFRFTRPVSEQEVLIYVKTCPFFPSAHGRLFRFRQMRISFDLNNRSVRLKELSLAGSSSVKDVSSFWIFTKPCWVA